MAWGQVYNFKVERSWLIQPRHLSERKHHQKSYQKSTNSKYDLPTIKVTDITYNRGPLKYKNITNDKDDLLH